MSSEKVSLWMQYGVDTSGRSNYVRTIVFPTHRLLPASTTAHMMYDVKDADLPRIIINNRLLKAGVINAAVATDQPEQVITFGIKELWKCRVKLEETELFYSSGVSFLQLINRWR
jgi:hypothetical protein